MDCGQPSFSPGSSCLGLLRNRTTVGGGRLRDYHPLRCGVPNRFIYPRRTVRDTPAPHVLSYNPTAATAGALRRLWFRHHPVRSPLLRVWFSLPPATEMFQLAGCPPGQARYPRGGELPHSEISGSQPVSGSPEHIGAVPRPSSARSARSRRPSGLRKTRRESNSLAHRTTWLRSDFGRVPSGTSPVPPRG